MRIGQKLIWGFVGIALLVAVVGYISVNTSQKTLQKSIGESSVILAQETLDKIDRNIHSRTEEFYSYCKDLILQETTIKSNQRFQKLDNIQDYIDEKDKKWRAAGKEEITPFMQELINSRLSEELREKIEFYEEDHRYKVFGEIFVTNKYGANAAQTGKTTDYRQDDEEWWQVAKRDGLYVRDVGYDESADVYSTDIGIRIDDENRNFLGVIKVVLNVEEVINIIKEVEAATKYKTTQFKLITKDGKLIYSTEDFEFFEDFSNELLSRFHHEEHGEHFGYFIAEGDKADEGDELFAHAHSKGYKDYKGLGWLLVIEHETEEIFAPVAQLRNRLVIISLGVAILAILMGLFISRAISNPLTKLRDAAIEIGKGNLEARIDVKSNDEVGQLSASFRKMAEDLKKTTTSIDTLNREITERKKAEEALKKALDEWETTFNSAKDSIMLIDSDFKIAQANLATSNFLGKPLNEILGKKCHQLFHGTDAAPQVCPLGRAKQTRKHEEVELCVSEKDMWIATSVDPILDDEGNISRVVHIVRDITDHKKAEQVLEKLNKDLEATVQELSRSNQELRDFAYIVSHDLKAPLRGIGTLAHWISTDYADKFDEDGREQMKLLTSRVERMHNLIEAILQYSRVGREKEEQIRVDLNELAQEVIDMVAPSRNIAITTKNQLPVIKCEETRIRQVFQNLLSNAVKYIDKPQGRIRIGCVEEDGFWKFSVADNGCGIEEKHFNRIFKIFQTLSLRDDFESTGIGLTVVKKIVELYGGRIWVESKPGEGSTFFFTLPKQKMEVKDAELEANIIGRR